MRWNISSLKFMYNMERFATQIYLTQRRAFDDETIIEELNAASKNEQEHVDVLRKRIFELQGNRSHIGFLFQTAARVLGVIAGIFGKIFVLKVDVFVENRAIKDYNVFLKRVRFDEDTVKLVEKLISDEIFHKENWESAIARLKKQN